MLGIQHHVAITCSNYQRSLEFYEKLGFTVLRRAWREAHQDYLTMLRCGEITLELFEDPHAPQQPNSSQLGLRHLAFRVENVEETAAQLNGMGIETEPIREDKINGGRLTFFRDPDGLPLELHE